MSTIKLSELQLDPAGWLSRIQAGETLIVVAQNEAIAEIRPVAAHLQQPRPTGLAAGEFAVPDDFDAPLPDSVLRDFEAA